MSGKRAKALKAIALRYPAEEQDIMYRKLKQNYKGKGRRVIQKFVGLMAEVDNAGQES
jgi:hypothetical protein